MSQEIQKLSDREHILLRPQMYIGSTSLTEFDEFNLNSNKIQYSKISYVPALIKIINEVIDNSVDASIRTNFKKGKNISVKITDNKVIVSDDGTGIPIKKNGEYWMPTLAWGHAKAGSNFENDNERVTIGMNGVGSYCTNVFSKKFKGYTKDGEKEFTVLFKNNAETFKEEIKDLKTNETGTIVEFEPDLEKFNLTIIDENHKNVIFQRLQNLAISYPEINFKFNNKTINFKTFKNYINLFGNSFEIYENENIKIGILPNDYDDFKQFSYVNGLKIPDGGIHIEAISSNIVSLIREKLVKKYKSLKPGDIKNKLLIVVFVNGMPNTKFNSQTKEKLTNTLAEFNKFANIDYKFVEKILKNKNIIEPIIEIYKIKEELEAKKALKDVQKVKKIKSEKYFKCVKKPKYLCICEGFSAYGGISRVLGNQDFEYYVLKGKPLNSYEVSNQKFAANRELSELYQILSSVEYDYILMASDFDLDGHHIRALISGFIEKYKPNLKNKFGSLNTPVKMVLKNDKPIKWTYDIMEDLPLKNGEVSKYFKGLGTFSKEILEKVIETDGLEKMIEIYNFDSPEIIKDFLSSEESDKRKEYIRNHKFSIASL